MKAKQKPLAVLSLSDLGLNADQVGSKGAKLQVEKLELPPLRGTGRIIEGDPAQAVAELVRLLREEAKLL
jgi:electron transfer flavoprotein beta subunit